MLRQMWLDLTKGLACGFSLHFLVLLAMVSASLVVWVAPAAIISMVTGVDPEVALWAWFAVVGVAIWAYDANSRK